MCEKSEGEKDPVDVLLKVYENGDLQFANLPRTSKQSFYKNMY